MADSIEDLVRAHDRDIPLIKGDLDRLEKGVGELKSTLANHDKKLDNVLEALRSTQHGVTMSSIKDWLQVLAMGFAIIAGVVSGIVYIAGNSQAKSIALLEYKIEKLTDSFTWQAQINDGK